MRLLRVPVALLLSLSLPLALPSVALAQVPPPPKGPAQPKAEPAPAPAPELTEEEKEEKAKDLYLKAEELAAEGKWAEAVPLYEEAYYLVPGRHGFAHKVGIATWEIGDCNKTKEYLTHFVTYAEGEKYEDKIAEAQLILDEIEARQCATEPEPEPEPEPEITSTENPLETENPLGEDPNNNKKDKPKGKKGLLVGGAVMIVLGAGGVGAGAAGLAMASGAGKSLDSLSSNQTATGYPNGDYACRVGDCPPDLEQKLQTGKIIGGVGFAVGGALLVTGVALIAVHAAKKKKAGGANAQAPGNVQLTAAGPMLLHGGAGAMAGIRF